MPNTLWKIDPEVWLGFLIGSLLSSLVLNIYLYISKTDPDFFPMIWDRTIYKAPTLRPTDNLIGTHSAKIVIIEYFDYQCPYSKQFNDNLNTLLVEYDSFVWVKRHRPLASHKYAEIASLASECAATQGAFWVYSNELFKKQELLSNPDTYTRIAKDLNLDLATFSDCFLYKNSEGQVAIDLESAKRRGISRTPTIYINDRRYDGLVDIDDMRKIFSKEEKVWED